MTKRLAYVALLAAALGVSLLGCTTQATPGQTETGAQGAVPVYERAAEVTSPVEARTLLEEGNARFIGGQANPSSGSDSVLPKDLSQARRDELAKGQHPFAVVVTCSDSRVPPEVLFDQALGDVFVVRVAGNVVDPVVLGSVEYAVEHLGAPLVVVMGHTKCGAVAATVEGGRVSGSIGSIIDLIHPAVDRAKAAGANEAELPEASADVNIEIQKQVIEGSRLLDEFVEADKLEIIGAKYDIASGTIDWF